MDSTLFDIIPNDLLMQILEYFPCKHILKLFKDNFLLLDQHKILMLLRRRLSEHTGLNTDNFDWTELENLCRLSQKCHISASTGHSVILGCNGQTYIFGKVDGQMWSDKSKQLGSDCYRPKLIDKLNNFTQFVAGVYESYGLNPDGNIIIYDSYEDSRLNKLQDRIVQISAGSTHSLFLTEKGNVYGYGANEHWQLLLKDWYIWSVTLIPTLSNIAMVAAGYQYSLVLTKDGKVYEFGNLKALSNGIGSNNNGFQLYPIPGMNNIISISAGRYHSLFLDKNGQVYSYGRNDHGQLGLRDRTNRNIPSLISISNKIVAISTGRFHSLILTDQGSVYSFGHNQYGQCGFPNDNYHIKTIPKLIPLSHKIISISAGMHHSLLLTLDGHVYSFGCNDSGQLGIGDTEDRFEPTLIPNFYI